MPFGTRLCAGSLSGPSNSAARYAREAQQVKASLQKFGNGKLGYLYDRIDPDASIRPNAVLALSLHHCGLRVDRQVLQVARDRLLTP